MNWKRNTKRDGECQTHEAKLYKLYFCMMSNHLFNSVSVLMCRLMIFNINKFSFGFSDGLIQLHVDAEDSKYCALRSSLPINV